MPSDPVCVETGRGEPELALHRRMFWARLSLALAAVPLALLIVMATVGGGTGSWLLVVALAVLMLPLFRTLGDTRPSLEVHPEGLLDRMALNGTEVFLSWDEIVDAEPAPFGVLRLRVRDPQRYLDDAGPLRRFGLRGIHGSHGAPFVLPGDLRTAGGQAVGREELEDLITARIDRKLRKEVQARKTEERRGRPS